jgi:amino acid adenylation domain-containing protein
LSERSDQLARHLRSLGAGPERLVAICVERSVEMIVGLVSILKAGAAYVPLDSSYPTERLRYMLEDCKPALVLTQGHLRKALPTASIPTFALDTDWNVVVSTSEDGSEDTEIPVTPRNLAYVIYTSGSTGAPKGVMVEHGNVTGFLAAADEWFQFEPGKVWSLFHSFSFDFSVLELWGALLSGAHLLIVPYATSRFPRDVHALLANEKVQVLNQTPSAFRQLSAVHSESPDALSLEIIILGGEALQVSALKPWYETRASEIARITNMYGPTETTVFVTYHPISPSETDPHGGSVIGTALRNSRICILEDDRGPAVVGRMGEINIGGAGVARGYLRRPDLTAQKFVADPADSGGGRLYRSGDLGILRADGTLEYRGRNDSQVKVRGFRIELGDIESHLTAVEGVREGIVVVQSNASGDGRLVAYLTVVDGVPITPLTLRATLLRRLPVHMVPTDFVILPHLPLSANGKIDRKALLTTKTPDASGSREASSVGALTSS